MKTQMTLLELSNELVAIGFPDLFDYDVEQDILNIEEMSGSVADVEGDVIVYFDIVKLGEFDKEIYRSHLDTIIEVDLEEIENANSKNKKKNEAEDNNY